MAKASRCGAGRAKSPHEQAARADYHAAQGDRLGLNLNRKTAQSAMAQPENMSARLTENSDRPDFSGLMGEVALSLLGEPTSKHHGGLEWRYGRYGSLSIDLQKNVYYDHEAGQGSRSRPAEGLNRKSLFAPGR